MCIEYRLYTSAMSWYNSLFMKNIRKIKIQISKRILIDRTISKDKQNTNNNKFGWIYLEYRFIDEFGWKRKNSWATFTLHHIQEKINIKKEKQNIWSIC